MKMKAYRKTYDKRRLEELSIFHTVEKPLPAVTDWRNQNSTDANLTKN